MNKLLIITLSLSLGFSAFADSIRITSNNQNPEPRTEKLTEVPQELLGILLDQGLKLTKASNGLFTLKVSKIHCDILGRPALDTEIAGIRTVKCRVNSEPVMFTKKGALVKEGRALVDVLTKIERDSEEAIAFSDCSMGGKCSADVGTIICTVDTKIETFSEGRFACTLAN